MAQNFEEHDRREAHDAMRSMQYNRVDLEGFNPLPHPYGEALTGHRKADHVFTYSRGMNTFDDRHLRDMAAFYETIDGYIVYYAQQYRTKGGSRWNDYHGENYHFCGHLLGENLMNLLESEGFEVVE